LRGQFNFKIATKTKQVGHSVRSEMFIDMSRATLCRGSDERTINLRSSNSRSVPLVRTAKHRCGVGEL